MPPFTFQFTLLQSYKALLVKLSPRGYLEEPGAMMHQAKSKIWTGVKPRRFMIGVDPKGAFIRIKDAVLRAQNEGRKRASEKIRKALPPELVQKVSPPREFGDMFGKNGVVRAMALLAVGSVSKAFMAVATCTTVDGAEILSDALNRPEDQPLITVSNHVSAIDDPLVVAAAAPLNIIMRPEHVRWTLCAHDRCFKNPVYTKFFQTTKVLPVERGAGLKQLGMRAAEYQLNQGQWVHIFPEGSRSQDGNLKPLKIGVGRLIAACSHTPLVVPIVHSGMDSVHPRGSSIPKPGKKVRIVVGEPIEVADLISKAREEDIDPQELYAAISLRVGQRMAALWSTLEGKPPPSWATAQMHIPSDAESIIWNERCYKGMWTIGTDWRPLSLPNIASNYHSHAIHILTEYLDYCKQRALGARSMVATL